MPQRRAPAHTGQERPPCTSRTPEAADAAADAVVRRSAFTFMSPLVPHSPTTGSGPETLSAPGVHTGSGPSYAWVARQPPPLARATTMADYTEAENFRSGSPSTNGARSQGAGSSRSPGGTSRPSALQATDGRCPRRTDRRTTPLAFGRGRSAVSSPQHK